MGIRVRRCGPRYSDSFENTGSRLAAVGRSDIKRDRGGDTFARVLVLSVIYSFGGGPGLIICIDTTHVSDPLPAAVGLQVLKILERDNLAAHAQRLGEIFRAFLLRMQTQYPCIGDIRGRGLMIGMEIVKDQNSKEPDEELGNALGDRMLELGLSANVLRIPGTGSCFRIAPPLTITEEELMSGLRIIEEAFKTTSNVKALATSNA